MTATMVRTSTELPFEQRMSGAGACHSRRRAGDLRVLPLAKESHRHDAHEVGPVDHEQQGCHDRLAGRICRHRRCVLLIVGASRQYSKIQEAARYERSRIRMRKDRVVHTCVVRTLHQATLQSPLPLSPLFLPLSQHPSSLFPQTSSFPSVLPSPHFCSPCCHCTLCPDFRFPSPPSMLSSFCPACIPIHPPPLLPFFLSSFLPSAANFFPSPRC